MSRARSKRLHLFAFPSRHRIQHPRRSRFAKAHPQSHPNRLVATVVTSSIMPPITRSKTLNDQQEAYRARLKLPSLPMEIKLMIYEHLLPSVLYATVFDSQDNPYDNDLWKVYALRSWKQKHRRLGHCTRLMWLFSLMSTCRTIRDDVAPLVYRRITIEPEWSLHSISDLIDQFPALCLYCLRVRLGEPRLCDLFLERPISST